MEPDVSFDVEAVAIANALAIAGDVPLAEEYYKRAIKKSPSPYYKVVNLGLYADFLFRQSRYDDGRKAYEDSTVILQNTTDFNKWANAYAFRMWFTSEAWNVPTEFSQAEECYRKARQIIATIAGSAARTEQFEDLELARQVSPLGVPPELGSVSRVGLHPTSATLPGPTTAAATDRSTPID
jgi:tetratricopeptide (TPR) repeat protein